MIKKTKKTKPIEVEQSVALTPALAFIPTAPLKLTLPEITETFGSGEVSILRDKLNGVIKYINNL